MTNVTEAAPALQPIPAGAPPGFHLLAKPSGSTCNIDCTYCFFLSKEALYPNEKSGCPRPRSRPTSASCWSRTARPQVTVAWQGGEPTLMGARVLQALRRVRREVPPARPAVQHTFQTNGILLDDDWCAFFKEHDFLVGLSVDGPREFHDAYRRRPRRARAPSTA